MAPVQTGRATENSSPPGRIPPSNLSVGLDRQGVGVAEGDGAGGVEVAAAAPLLFDLENRSPRPLGQQPLELGLQRASGRPPCGRCRPDGPRRCVSGWRRWSRAWGEMARWSPAARTPTAPPPTRPRADGVDGHPEDVDDVDEDAGRLPRGHRHLEPELDVLVAEGVQGQQGGGRLRRLVTGEIPVDEDDPPGEERGQDLVTEGGLGRHVSRRPRPRWKSRTLSTAAA